MISLEALKVRIIERRTRLNANLEWRTRLPLAEACREYLKALPLIREQENDLAQYRKQAGLPKYAEIDFLKEKSDAAAV
jgi:hypothetical protein